MDSLLGPDKRLIKASSDFHLTFFLFLSDFFFKKNVLSLNQSTYSHHKVSINTNSFHK